MPYYCPCVSSSGLIVHGSTTDNLKADLECHGTFHQPYSCLTAPESRCMNNSNGISDIGIGMSVGGIALLLVTLGMVIVIQYMTTVK